MRYSVPRRIVILCLFLLLTSLSACADPSSGIETPESATENLRAHYDALVVTLQEELSTLRTDTYITTETLLSRIEALESALKSLGAAIPDETAATRPADSTTDTTPTSDEPDTESESIAPSLPEQDTAAVPPPDSTRAEETTPASFAGLQYAVENGTVTITGYRADPEQHEAHLIIPATIDGYSVTRIADNAFEGASVESVVLPPSVTHIGWFAFMNCQVLRTVTLPASVTHIDYGAFDGCPLLTLYCPRASYAARYAAASAIPFKEA